MRYLHLGWALTLAGLVAPTATPDTIVYVDGRKPTTGVKVLDETVKEIQYRQPRIRQPQSIDAEKVAEVQYSDADNYVLATENFAMGAYGQARPLFELALKDEADGRKGFEAKCAYMMAECDRRMGNLQDAVKAFTDIQKNYANSRYVPPAVLGRGLALLVGNNDAGARKAFEELKGFGGRWAQESELQSQMLDEDKNPSAALETYKRLAASSDPGVANKARLRIGRVLIAQRKYGEAKTFFETVIAERSETTPREVVAGAFNGLGASIWRNPAASAADYRTALYHHLRVIVSYGDIEDEQAEALYSAGALFSVVPGDENASRSQYYLRRCVSLYGDSGWGQKAAAGVPKELQGKS